MNPSVRVLAAAWLGLAALASPGLALAYETSKDAHKACDPKGVQYDAKTKSFCCGTKGGCPAGAAMKGSAAGAAAADKAVKPGATVAPAATSGAKPAANK